MFLKSELTWNVVIKPEELDINGLALQKSIIVRLMDDFAAKKCTRELGHHLAVTNLNKIGEGKVRDRTGDVLFPVTFSCLSFKLFKGEVLEGVVHKILKHGVFLKTGPLERIYLSSQKMPDYEYLAGENPVFISKSSKIERDTAVRFRVVGEQFIEEGDQQAVVGLDGDFLGPI